MAKTFLIIGGIIVVFLMLIATSLVKKIKRDQKMLDLMEKKAEDQKRLENEKNYIAEI